MVTSAPATPVSSYVPQVRWIGHSNPSCKTETSLSPLGRSTVLGGLSFRLWLGLDASLIAFLQKNCMILSETRPGNLWGIYNRRPWRMIRSERSLMYWCSLCAYSTSSCTTREWYGDRRLVRQVKHSHCLLFAGHKIIITPRWESYIYWLTSSKSFRGSDCQGKNILAQCYKMTT